MRYTSPIVGANLKPENRYTLDCVQEMGAMSPAEAMWYFKVCPDPDAVLDRLMIDANVAIGDLRDHSEHLRALERMVSDHAHGAIPDSPDPLRCYMADLRFHRSALFAACDYYDETLQVNGERVLRSLNRSFAAVAATPDEAIQTYIEERKADERRRQEVIDNALRELEQINARIWNEMEDEVGRANLVREHIARRHERPNTKRVRASFRRSHALAASIFGRDRLAQIIRERKIEVDGQLYRYRVAVKADTLLTTGGHGQTTLTVLTLAGDEVCDLCIYSADCTLLDHIASIYVHVTTGEELEVLHTGNVLNVRPGREKDADFIRGGPAKHLPVIDPELIEDVRRRAAIREENRTRRLAFLTPQLQTHGLVERYPDLFEPATNYISFQPELAQQVVERVGVEEAA